MTVTLTIFEMINYDKPNDDKVIAKPIEISKLVKQIKKELD
jgi:hypothetical protein